VPSSSVDLAAADAGAGRTAMAALARASGASLPLAVTLCLPARAVLRKSLALPLAVEENLRQVIGYDLDRHTPFKPDELYFDAAVASRDASRGVLRVELAAARRSVVDPLLQKVESWGGEVVAVSPDLPAGARSLLDLLPPERRNVVPLWRRWEVWVPIAVLALLALLATLLPIWQKREQAIALRVQADAAREQAAVSETLRAELDRRVGDYNFALERKFAFPPTVQTLDEVTRILPDDTWLTQFELRTSRGKDVTRELGLRGESANAGRLVGMLEESKLFTQAAPRSPTTKIQPGPGEIFDVGAQLKPLPPPSPAPLVVTQASVHGAAASPPPPHPANAPAAPGASSAAAPKSAPAAQAPPPAAAAPGAAPAPANAPGATAAPGAAPAPAAAPASATAPAAPAPAAKGRP
jgi:general secretion pathway protein L